MALPVLTEREAGAYSPNVLAFYGDCVYELLVRREVVLRGNTNAGRLHDLAVEQVRASYQSMAVDVIEPMLTEKESDILRRGRNAGGISVPKSAKSTAGRPHWRLCSVISAFRGSRNVLRSCLRRFARLFRSERGGVFP